MNKAVKCCCKTIRSVVHRGIQYAHRFPMRFAEGQYGLCGGAVGLSAPVAEAATVDERMVICASLTSGVDAASPLRGRDAPAPNGG